MSIYDDESDAHFTWKATGEGEREEKVLKCGYSQPVSQESRV